MSNIFNYKGIEIIDNSSDVEFNGSYLDEPIVGYAIDVDQAKEKIDDSIKFIEEFSKTDNYSYAPKNSHKMSSKSIFIDED